LFGDQLVVGVVSDEEIGAKIGVSLCFHWKSCTTDTSSNFFLPKNLHIPGEKKQPNNQFCNQKC
jgi:hypothetical protein